MARPLKPLVHSGGWYPSKKWIPLVRNGGYTTANGGEQPEPEAVLKTVTGSLIHITDALALPAEALSVNVDPIQDLHGYDSPWPSGGGKNLLGNFRSGSTINGIAYSINADGSIHASGTATAQSNFYFYPSNTFSVEAGTYTLSVSGSNAAIVIWGGSSGTAGIPYSEVKQENPTTFTSETGGTVGYTILRIPIGVTVDADILIQLERGSTATAWTPYENLCPISGRTSATIYHSGADTSDPTTYTIQLGDTVYGGTLDVTAGTLTGDKTYIPIKGAGAWILHQNGFFYATISGKAPGTTNIVSDIYTTKNRNSWTNDDDFVICGNPNTGQVYIRDSRFTTQAEFRANADGNMCFQISTPQTYTLTPTQIEMLLGENNLWADAGDSTLTYYAEGEASTSEALGILLGGAYNNPGGADDVSDDEALGILLGGS